MKKLLLILVVLSFFGCEKQRKIDEDSYIVNYQIPEGATDIEIIDPYYAYFTLDDRRYIVGSMGMTQITED